MAIIKTISNATLESCPAYFEKAIDSGKVKRNLGNFEYIHLSDTGGIYGVSNSPEGYYAVMYLASDKVTERTNIWKMMIGAKAAPQPDGISNCFKTLKELKDTLNNIHSDWEKTVYMSDEEAKEYLSQKKKNSKTTTSSGGGIPFWVWIVVGFLIVLVIASL
jgi:hypothetical protein